MFSPIIYQININKEIYSLVCFSRFLNDEDRSDRVIADKWDTAYTLHIGKISDKDLDRLNKNVPLQESGRNSPKELVLSRANKSVRLFKKVVECLSKGVATVTAFAANGNAKKAKRKALKKFDISFLLFS